MSQRKVITAYNVNSRRTVLHARSTFEIVCSTMRKSTLIARDELSTFGVGDLVEGSDGTDSDRAVQSILVSSLINSAISHNPDFTLPTGALCYADRPTGFAIGLRYIDTTCVLGKVGRKRLHRE